MSQLNANGWKILFYTDFRTQWEELKSRAIKLKSRLDPEDFLRYPDVKLLKAVDTGIRAKISLDSTSPSDAQKILITSLTKELKSRGMLDVLRNGFKCYGKIFQVAYFQPNTAMNPDTLALYQQNRLTLTRQVKIKKYYRHRHQISDQRNPHFSPLPST